MGGSGGGASGEYKTIGAIHMVHSLAVCGLPIPGNVDNWGPKGVAAYYPSFGADSSRWGTWQYRHPLNLFDLLQEKLLDDNPLEDDAAYDPGSLTAAGIGEDVGDEHLRNQLRLNELRELVTDGVVNTDPTSGTRVDLGAWLVDRMNEAADAGGATAYVESAVDAWEAATLRQHLRSINRVASSFRDINMVQSSHFPIAMVDLESERSLAIGARRAELEREYVAGRVQMLQVEASLRTTIIQAQMEAGKMSIVEHYDRSEVNRTIDRDAALWDFEGFEMLGNFLGSVAGAAVPHTKDIRPNKGVSSIAGAIGGAGIGFMAAKGGMLGSAILPGVGTAIGAVVGGLAGLLSAS